MANIDIIVGASVDGALGGLRAVDGAINRLQPAAKAIGAIGKAAFVAISAAVAGSVAALVSFVNQASEAEQVLAKFESIVGASGLSDYKDEMLKLADSLSQVTRFEDEAILSAETQLALYENIGQDIFPQVIDTALDLAEVMGVDAVQGAESLGRALADIEGGSLSLLKRQRLLTEEQVKTAEAMAEAGDVAGAQAYVLDILDSKIGNLAETMGQTFSGKVTILKNKLGNLAEEIGGKLLPVLTPLVDRFAELVDTYGPKLVALFDEHIVPGVQKAVEWIGKFIDILTGEQSFDVGAWLTDIDWEEVSGKIISAIESVDWNKVGETIGDWLLTAFQIGKDIATEFDWSGLGSAIWDAIVGTGEGISKSFGGAEDWDKMWADLNAQLQTSLDNYGPIGLAARFYLAIAPDGIDSSAVTLGISQSVGKAVGDIDLSTLGATLLSKLANSMLKYVYLVVNAATTIAGRIKTKFGEAASKFNEIGKNILAGIKKGINDGWDDFASWLTGIVEQIVQSVLDTLGIQSPSKVFADIGKQMMAGMAQGIARGAVMPMQTMQMATAGVIGSTQNVQHNYYYGARLMLSQGQEGQILSTLTE